MMRAIPIAIALTLLLGCTKVRPCKNGTALLTVNYEGDATSADQLRLDISVNGGAAETTTLNHSSGASTGTVEVDFSGSYPTGATMDIVATALSNGNVVGMTTDSVAVVAGCTNAQLTIGGTGQEADMAGGSDGGANPDLAPHIPSISLYAAINYPTGKTPFASVTADFNRDGKLDFAVANFGSNSVSVSFGDGAGGFGAPSSFDVTSSPTGIVTADFDGKNGPDVAVITGPSGSSGASGAVHILLNDGTGKLVLSATSYAVGTGQGFILTADFNHDAKPDIVVLNYGSNNSNMGVVNILLNKADGSGGMLPPQSVATSSDAFAFAVADFDNISGPDIAIFDIHGGGTPSSDIRILLNNGYGSFSTTTIKGPFTVPAGVTFNMLAADFDGKNGPDLVLTNGNIMLNDGTGTLGASTALSGFPTTCGDALVVDFNKDTHPDVFCAVPTGGVALFINKGDGTGTFNASASSVAATANSASLGDFNGDGKLDALVGNSDTASVTALLNDGTGQNTFIAARAVALGGATIAMAAVDTNADKNVDLIAASQTSGSFSVALGDGHGAFAAATNYSTGLAGIDGMAVADLNNDQKPDVVATHSIAAGGVRVLLNSSGAFPTPVPYTVGAGSAGVVLANLDAKNGPDIAVADTGGNIYVLLNDGAGTFSVQGPFPTGAGASPIVAADFDQDGAIDLATGNTSANTVSVLLNNGSGVFTAAKTAAYPTGMLPIAAAVGDINGDTVADLVVANFQDATLTVYTNKADHTGTLVKLTDLATDLNPRSVAIVDINGDGKADIVATAQNGGALDVFPNLGNGTFGGAISYGTSTTPTALTLGDVNGDGLIDIAVGTAYTNSNVLLNTSH
jgi:hypothetical protein